MVRAPLSVVMGIQGRAPLPPMRWEGARLSEEQASGKTTPDIHLGIWEIISELFRAEK